MSRKPAPLTAVSMCFFVLVSSVATAQSLQDVAYYGCDEGSGIVLGDSVGAYDGTWVGTPQWTSTTPMEGHCIGPFSAANYVVLPNEVLSDRQEGSISFWIYLTSWGPSGIAARVPLSWYEGAGIYGYISIGSSVGPSQGSVSFNLNGEDISTGAGLIQLGQWHKIEVAWDGTTRRIFVDGVLEADFASSATFPPVSSVTLGKYVALSGYYVTGYVDEVAIGAGDGGDDFMWGICLHQYGPGMDASKFATHTHALVGTGGFAKFWLNWGTVQEIMPKDCQVTKDQVTEDMINAYAEGNNAALEALGYDFEIDWRLYDEIVLQLGNNDRKVECFPWVCDGGTAATPKLSTGSSELDDILISMYGGLNISPNYLYVGPEHYLGGAYLFTAAAARRYDGHHTVTRDDGDHTLPHIRFWNLENELNWTLMHQFLGWRYWWDPAWGILGEDFRIKLLKTLHQAVERGNPFAKTTMNINCGVYGVSEKSLEFIQKRLNLPEEWVELLGTDPLGTKEAFRYAVTQYGPITDIVGLGFYDGYYENRSNVCASLLSDAIKSARETMQGMGEDKPIIIMETAFPTLHWLQPAIPQLRRWNEKAQCHYISETTKAAQDAGAMGYFYWRMYDAYYDPGVSPLPQDSNSGLIKTDNDHTVLKEAFYEYQKIISDYRQTQGTSTP